MLTEFFFLLLSLPLMEYGVILKRKYLQLSTLRLTVKRAIPKYLAHYSINGKELLKLYPLFSTKRWEKKNKKKNFFFTYFIFIFFVYFIHYHII